MEDIDRLLDEILVDAYGESEQLTAFEVAFEDAARLPFPARIVGTNVEVVKVEFEGDERRGLTAVCSNDGAIHRVALSDLTPGAVTMGTSQLLIAYRRWLGLPPLPEPEMAPAPEPWTYQRVAHRTGGLSIPLALRPAGTWDPTEQYWGEDDEKAPLIEVIIAAGPRAEFEMEQVIPGLDEDDWDSDPIGEAADLHGAGYNREAAILLKKLIAQDERCIDAWVHLGNIAFDTKGPQAALLLYDRAVSIGEQALPEGFNGALPRGLIDNRPFLRALHGLGLCAWRQRRWDEAETVFTNLVWIDGGSTWTALECLDAVRARQRWTRD